MPANDKSVGSRTDPVSRAERARTHWQTGSSAPSPAPAAPRPRTSLGVKVNITILYLLVALLAAMNGILVWQLLMVLNSVTGSVDQFTALATQIEDEVIVVPIHVDETFPVSVSVPFEYSETFPVNTTVPISTTLMVPFEVMGSTINLKVPVDMSVPVNLSVPVSLAKTFEISTTVPVKFDMNVEVRLADTPIPGYLDDLKALLTKMTTFPWAIATPLNDAE